MIFVDNEGTTDARLNLAIEEYLLERVEGVEDILLFYVNAPSVIIGRNQNTLEEINPEYVAQHGIQVVRRLSGGGAVYHDLGNLNFSFITRNLNESVADFKKFTAPVVRALNQLGVPAELGGRNDLLVDGKKISGNASFRTKRGVVSHGTLLYDADLDHLTDALKVKAGKIESKGIKSVRSRVTNIRPYLPEPMPLHQFRQRLLESIFEGERPIPQYHLDGKDWAAIRQLAESRYYTWDWNYGRSPDFNLRQTQRFPFGEIDAWIDVQRGRIKSVKFYGDFFGQDCLAELEQRLVGLRYRADEVWAGLDGFDPSPCFGGELTREEFTAFFCRG
jgi:lipoate---protein ligase